jgi:hypothetical protein
MWDGHLRASRDRSAHGDRVLFLDDVVIGRLLAFFKATLPRHSRDTGDPPAETAKPAKSV